ncbi:Pyrrolo-quinoline quinone repeat [Trinorchestia longiramus]|nr:Pyrrolo-quinoline quinone repeat [Trinorchestia longiramus]
MAEFILEPGSLLELLGRPSFINSSAITWLRGNGSQLSVTYCELHDAVAELCDELHLREPQQLLVVVCGDMGTSSVAVLLSALHSNAYFYLDPDLIELQSTCDLISCIAPALIVVDKNYASGVSWMRTSFDYVKSVHVFDLQFLVYASVEPQPLTSIVNRRGLAYAITTSGSTGVPKIVFVPRSCIAPNIRDLVREFQITDKDVIFNAAPLSFDPSIVNILASLYSGAHLLVASKEMVPSIRIVSCLLKVRVTIIQMTPSLFRLWHRQQNLSECLLEESSSVRILALGGESAPMAWLESIGKNLQKVVVYSLYGITEVSSWSSIKNVSPKFSYNTRKIHSSRSSTVVQNAPENLLVFREELDLGDLLSETSLCLVKDGIVCEGDSEGEIFLAETDDQVMIATAVRRAVLNLTKVPCKICFLPRLPINSHGKIDDRQLMKEHNLQISVNCWNEKLFLELVNKLWLEFCHSAPKPDVNFHTLGLNSLQAVEFLEILREKVHVNFLGALDSLLNGSYQTVVEDLKSLLDTSFKVTNDRMIGTSTGKRLKVLHKNFARVIFSKLHNLIGGIETPVEERVFLKSAHLVWTVNLSKCIDASPVLVLQDNGCSEALLFIGSHSSQFCCLNAFTGCVRWSAMLESRMEASSVVNSSASQVYAVCYSGRLYCFDVASGDLLWKFKAGAEIKCSPTVDYESGKLFFGSHDKYFYCVNADGSLSWKALHSGGSIFASPCVSDVVCAACLKGTVGCYDKDSGELIWQRNLNAPVFASLVSFCRGVLCVSVDRRLTALSNSGSVLWSYELRGQCYCTPRVLRLSQRELICLGDNSGTVYLICQSGRLLSHFDLGCRVVSTPFLYMCNGIVMAVLAATNGKVVFCKFIGNKEQLQDPLPEHECFIRKPLSAERAAASENCDCNNCVSDSINYATEIQSFPQGSAESNTMKSGVLQDTAPRANIKTAPWSSSLAYELSYPDITASNKGILAAGHKQSGPELFRTSIASRAPESSKTVT